MLTKLSRLDLSWIHEIIVVDNRSKDSTYNCAVEAMQSLKLRGRVVRNSINAGLGGTHKMAYKYAIENFFDGVIVFHGDDQGSFNDFSYELISKNKDKFIMGARFTNGSQLHGYSKFRIVGNIVFNFLFSLALRKVVTDLGSGLNYFPVALLKKHRYLNYSNDLTFPIYVLVNAIKSRQPLVFVPIKWTEDDQVSNVKLFSQSAKVFKILTQSVFKSFVEDRLSCQEKIEWS